MNITFKKLTPELADEYLYFFDHMAFTDHEEWSLCYCLESHLSKEENHAIWSDKAARRERAAELIRAEIMQGYLVYDGELVMGWCNAGDKIGYGPVIADEGHYTMKLREGVVKIIYCIEITPAYRGKGIAHLIMEKVCEDAKAEGYSFVEGFPFADKSLEYQFHGPYHLFERHGFTCLGEKGRFCIMQKSL